MLGLFITRLGHRMRHIQIDTVDHVPRPIIAIGNDYKAGHRIAPHQHRRGQLISGASGLIVLATPEGTWVMPPQRGMWIPPATEHHVRMVGAVSMQSLYVEPNAVCMPAHCQVVGISPFMRSLITEVLDLPLEYESGSRTGTIMGLIAQEMPALPVLPLSLQYPTHGRLAERCRRFVEQPSIHETIDDWSNELGMSRRTFTACSDVKPA
jgi:hypothetical protein